MKPGKTYLPFGVDHLGAGGRGEVSVDARDRFAFAVDVGDVARIGGDDFAVFDQECHSFQDGYHLVSLFFCVLSSNSFFLHFFHTSPTSLAEPAGRDDFLLGVELHGFPALDVEVAEEGVVPAGEGEHRHRRGHADVDADHAGLHAVLELARGLAAVREDRGAVAEGGLVGLLDGAVEVVHAHDVEHGAEDFLAGERHVGLHAVDDGGAEVKTARGIGHFHAAAVGDDFRAFLFAAGDEAQHAVAVLRGDDRAHVGLRGPVGGADLDRVARPSIERGQQALGGGADGDRGRAGHAAFAGAAERGGRERLDGLRRRRRRA